MTFLDVRHSFKQRVGFALSVMIAAGVVGTTMERWPAQGQSGNQVATVSAASFEAVAVAPEAIVSAFGPGLATDSKAADATPLPTTLAGTTVSVKDSGGMERPAALLFVSPAQINFLIPAGTSSGEAIVSVTSGNGGRVSTGTVQIAQVAPGLFTANANGKGVAAAVTLRRAAGRPDEYKSVARLDRTQDCFVHEPINLNPANERVFLLLYGTGIRGHQGLSGVTLQIGGVAMPVAYAGAQGGFAGLDQINVELPRALSGLGVISLALTADGFSTSNPVTIEIAPPDNDVNSPKVTGFSLPTPLVGETLTIDGANFDPVKNLVLFGCTETTRLESATATRLSLKVPFGTASGQIAVRTSKGQGVSTGELMLSTSLSGYIENTNEVPLPGMSVRIPGYPALGAVTDREGAFILPLPGVPSTSGLVVEIVPPATLPYTLTTIKLPVAENRDNHAGRRQLQQILLTGQNALPFGASGTPATATLRASFNPGQAATRSIRDSGMTFVVVDNTTAVFPGGGSSGTIFLNLVEQSRTPAELPPGVFSSTIGQLTPFGVRLTPGGKLIFPNNDRLAPTPPPRLYRFDQTPGSPTLGTFVEAGPATVSDDGGFVQTLPTAITETSIFLVAVPRRVTTVIGRVLESDRQTSARGAIVRANGQETSADGNGGFTLRNVSVPVGVSTPTVELTVEASFQRPSGRVDRTQKSVANVTLNGVTNAGELVLPVPPFNRPPVIVAPSSLEVTEGLILNAAIVAYDQDADQTVQVNLTGQVPAFAALTPGGNNNFTLRLAPLAGVARVYTLTLTATDNEGASTSQSIRVTVNANRPPEVSAPASLFAALNQPFRFNISATDLDNTPPGIVTPQTFTFSLANLLGATLTPLVDGVSARFDWTPSDFGTVTPSFTARDNGIPPLSSASRNTTIFVGLPWAPTSGIEAAQTFALFPDGTNLLAATSGGVFRTTNVGGRWAARNIGLTTLHTNTLARSGATLLAGTNGGGVFSSTDDGENWTSCGSLPNGVIRSLAVTAQGLFAGTFGGGVFRSTNACQTWTPVNAGLNNLAINVLAVSGSTLYVGTEGGGVFRSSDNGQSWQPVNDGLANLKVRALAATNTNLFAGTDGSGIYCAANPAQGWTSCNNGLINPATTINALIVSGTDVFACTSGDGAFRSINQGGNWIPLKTTGLKNLFVSSFAVSSFNPYFAGTAGGGVFRSLNQGDSWMEANTGLATSTVNALTDNGVSLYAGTAGGGVFGSNDQGQTWLANNNGLTAPYVNAFTSLAGTLFAATNGGVFSAPLSVNPLNWTARINGLPEKEHYAITLLESTGRLYVGIAPDGGVYRSDNQGESWFPVNNGITDRNIQSLKALGSILLAGTENSGIFRSTDGGQNWTQANTGLTSLRVHALTAGGTTFYAGTANGVHRSTDQGQSWTPMSAGLPDRAFVNALLINNSNLYAGIFGGLYFFNDQAQVWTAANIGLAHSNVFSLAARSATLFVGTIGGGVYLNPRLGVIPVSPPPP